MSRLVPSLLVLLLAACAAPSPSTTTGGPTTDVEVLASGYLVDNTVLASPDELKAYLVDRQIRTVTLKTAESLSPERRSEARLAIKEAGAEVAGGGAIAKP